MIEAAPGYKGRPKSDVGFFHFLMPGNKINFTCNNCSLVCHPDKETRKRRYRMLTQSGVVVQHPDGSLKALKAVSPDEAIYLLQTMPPEHRALYEKT